MRHIMQYEFNTLINKLKKEKYNSITIRDKYIIIYLYDLISEFENIANNKNLDISTLEDNYYTIVSNLLIGKVITYNGESNGKTTGVCEDVSFESGFGNKDIDQFQVEFISILIYNEDDYDNIDNDKVIIHLDKDPELYKNIDRYNI